MGCFYATCMLTQAPISSGTPVRLIVLTQRSSAVSCSALGYEDETSLWTPVCLPMRGSYDDYGGVEAVAHDAASDILLAYLEGRHGRRFELETLTRTLIDAPDQRVSRPALLRSSGASGSSGASPGSGRAFVEEARPAAPVVDRYGFALIPETIYQATLVAGGAVDDLAVRWRSVMGRYQQARTAQRRQRAVVQMEPTTGANAVVRDSVEDAEGAAPEDAQMGPLARRGGPFSEPPDDITDDIMEGYMEGYMEAVMLFHEAPSGEYLLERYCDDAAPAMVRDAICLWGIFWITLRRLHKLFQPQFVSGSQQPPYRLHRAVAHALRAYLTDAEHSEELVDDEATHPSDD